jgi:hypothetical protein
MNTPTFVFAATVLMTPASGTANDEHALKNWYNDPFFSVSTDVQGCPVPLGPMQTEREMQREAHARVERGTRCFQQGQCTRPNSYLYDADIAANLRQALAGSPALKGTSLWIGVQRRWVFIQGCAAAQSRKAMLKAIATRIPDVERVFLELRVDRNKAPPYPVIASAAADQNSGLR